MDNNSCDLCSANINSKELDHFIWNTILYESDNFIIVPSIGPLVVGQAMILSKKHSISLASMSSSDITECADIISYVIERIEGNILFSEHGSFNQQKGGGCIEHTHIHILPGLGKYYNILSDALPTSELILNYGDINKIGCADFPYILNLNSELQVSLHEAYNCHSQMMRKAICQEINNSNFNWRDDSKIDLIEETVKLWTSIV